MKDRVKSWLDDSDITSCIHEVGELTEKERKQLWACVQFHEEDLKNERRYIVNEILRFGSASPDNMQFAFEFVEGLELVPGKYLAAVYRSRSDSWKKRGIRHLSFSILRNLVLEGALPQPQDGPYYLRLFLLISTFQDLCLYDFLMADPGLLKTEVWRMFRVQGEGHASLENADNFCKPGNSWKRTLARLMKEGRLSRSRLLDESLHSLTLGFPPIQNRWFVKFHEYLEPKDDEREERLHSYLGLLQSMDPALVTFAFKTLTEMHKRGSLDSAKFLDSIDPVLRQRSKGIVKRALSTVAKLGKSKSLQNTAIAKCLIALEHDAADIQEKALSVFEKLGGNTSEIGGFASFISPTVSIGQSAPEGVQESGSVELVPIDWAKCFYLHPDQIVVPISSVEEMLERLFALLDSEDDPVEWELVFEAIGRLADCDLNKEQAEMANRIATRAVQIVERGRSIDASGPMAAWWALRLLASDFPMKEMLSKHVVGDDGKISGWSQILAQGTKRDIWLARLESLIDGAKKQKKRVLLSLPTHRPAWVCPRILEQRIHEAKNEKIPICKYDLQLARLRSPNLKGKDHLSFPFEPSYSSWEHSFMPMEYTRFSSIRPTSMRPYFERAIIEVAANYTFETPIRTQPRILDPLLNPDVELSHVGCKLIAWALACKDPMMTGMAIDVATCAIEDARVLPVDFGMALNSIWLHEFADEKYEWPLARLPLRRHAATLKELGQASELHNYVVDKSIELGLSGLDATIQPKDLASLLETYLEIKIVGGSTSIEDTGTRDFLKAVPGKGKASKLAAKLLDLEGQLTKSFAERVKTQHERAHQNREERWQTGAIE